MQSYPNVFPFGVMPNGTQVHRIDLNCAPLFCQIITYGGAVRSITVPDRTGAPVDVVLGMETLEDYFRQDKFLGALVGRYANRIGGARFSLNGKEYSLAANNGENHLHGGPSGFDKQVWHIEDVSEQSVTLSLTSPDGQEGYPGELTVRVIYRLSAEGLELEYSARTTADTLCSLTNHTYFNLSGHASGPVLDQEIQLLADWYTPTVPGSIPTGELAPVDGTPMDLRKSQPIGLHIDDSFDQLTMAGGYDHNWVLAEGHGEPVLAARAFSPKTGIAMETWTTKPGVQFYAGNYLGDCPAGKGGAPYSKRWGFCLETQFFPDSPNKPSFPSSVLKPGETYSHRTIYRFSIQD